MFQKLRLEGRHQLYFVFTANQPTRQLIKSPMCFPLTRFGLDSGAILNGGRFVDTFEQAESSPLTIEKISPNLTI